MKPSGGGDTAEKALETFKKDYAEVLGDNYSIAGIDFVGTEPIDNSNGSKEIEIFGVDSGSGLVVQIDLINLTPDDPTVKAVIESIKFK